MSGAAATPRLAATVMLLRDGPRGIEVFMQVRHEAMNFASGALVFPGGRVDEDDYALGRDAGLCPNPEGIAEEELGFRVAGVRETFEECGILLAHQAGTGAAISPERLDEFNARYRLASGGHSIDLAAMLRAEGLTLRPHALVPFARWITPVTRPKRFDTVFLLARAPENQLGLHDGTESVESLWLAPERAIADGEAGRFNLMFPTMMNLRKLGRAATVEEALAAARQSRIIPILPEMVGKGPGNKRRMRIPEEAGYGGSLFEIESP